MMWCVMCLLIATVAYVRFVQKYILRDCVKHAQYEDIDNEFTKKAKSMCYPNQILCVEFYNGKKEYFIKKLYRNEFEHYPGLDIVKNQKQVWEYHYKAVEYGSK